MNTPALESLLLSDTGDSLYEFDICTAMLRDAISANCVGNAHKFYSLTQLMVELQLQHVLDDLESCEDWNWPEIERSESAYAQYEKSAAANLSDLVANCEFLSEAEIRTHISEIHRFLGALPGQAYERIKRAVESTEPKLLPKSHSPRPNDIA
jgi:hypothetical protein